MVNLVLTVSAFVVSVARVVRAALSKKEAVNEVLDGLVFFGLLILAVVILRQ